METGFNSPVTTSMGRFFDAVSSQLDIKHIISYEGEAAVALEMAIDESFIDKTPSKDLVSIGRDQRYEIRLQLEDDSLIIDDIHIFSQVLEDAASGTGTGLVSLRFHNTLAQIITDISCRHISYAVHSDW